MSRALSPAVSGFQHIQLATKVPPDGRQTFLTVRETFNHNETSSVRTGLDSFDKDLPPIPKTSKYSFRLWTWRLQILASVLSLASMATLVALLYRYSNQPLSAWPYTHLTLNGAVGAITTLIRIALMLPVADATMQGGWIWFSRRHRFRKSIGHNLKDLELFSDAARGAYGAIKLLFKLKLHIVSVGAGLSILSLGLETFSQQVLDIHDKIGADVSVRGIPRVTEYNTYDPLSWTAAIYSGIFADQIPDITSQCPTGDCTWPTSASLGVCGECMDITEQLEVECDENDCTYTTPAGNATYQCLAEGRGAGTVFGLQGGNVSLTTGRPNVNYPFLDQYGMGTVFPLTQLGLGSGIVFGANSAGNFSGSNTPVAVFDIINVNISSTLEDKTVQFRYTKPQAVECGLWICLQAYETSMIAGNQVQSVKRAWNEVQWTWEDQTARFINIPSDMNSGNEIYSYSTQVSQEVFCGLNVDGLSVLFNDTGKYQPDMSPPYPKYESHQVLTAIHENLPDLNPWIKRFAKSLSNNMRTTKSDSAAASSESSRYAGTSYSNQAWIGVRWPWLALPMLEVIMSILFLAVSIFQTARVGVPAWKGSPLFLLCADIDPEVKRVINGKYESTPDELAELIGDRRVVLSRDEESGRWLFRRVSGDRDGEDNGDHS